VEYVLDTSAILSGRQFPGELVTVPRVLEELRRKGITASEETYLDRVRVFNKRYFNRFSRRFAGTARGPFALIRYVGRKTGTHYETPLLARPMPLAFAG